jgi:tetrapyrrole methylase family protein/MazG family protein
LPLNSDSLLAELVPSTHAEVHLVSQTPLTGSPADEISSRLAGGAAFLDGALLRGRYYPPFSPSMNALIFSPALAGSPEALHNMLRQVYPEEHEVYIKSGYQPGEHWQETKLERLAYDSFPLLMIPRRSEDSSLESFADVIAHLRAPNGCPWDRKQTHRSLRTYLLEETYEALADLDEGNLEGLREELGDLVLQILLHAQIAQENSEFNLSEILEGINRKIIYRHPHVFGEVNVRDDQEVVQNWEKLKEKEREENGTPGGENGILNGVPLSFPALAQAQSIQDRAARVCFDWADIAPVKAKVMEELAEVESAPDEDERAKELGDLLFAVVNLSRWYKVDAESALREASLKFRTRFAHIEQRAKELGKSLSEMTLEEMDSYWDEAKGIERS